MDPESILMVVNWQGFWGMGEEMKGLRNTNRQLQNSHGDVKYSIGNEVVKELISTDMNNGGEQPKGKGSAGWKGGTKGENQDNCNSIINEI